MVSPKLAAVVGSALIVGAVLGRWTSPESPERVEKSGPAFSSMTSASATPQMLGGDPGTSRAVADVTPGREAAKQERVLSLLELMRMNGSRKLWENAKRFSRSLDRAGVQSALQQVELLPPNNVRRSLRYSLVMRLVELDPAEAVRYVGTVKEKESRESLYGTIGSSWAETDFAAAKAWANGLPEGSGKRQAMAAMIGVLAEKDPDAALKMVLALPNLPGNSYNFAWAVFGTMTSRNPLEAARRAAALPGNDFRQQAIQIVASNWSGTDPKAAAAWAQGLTGNLQRNALRSVISTWTRTDPNAAAEFVDQLPPGQSRNEMYGNIAQQWAEQDPTATAAWVDKLPPGNARESAVRNVVSQWAQNDPRKAADYVMQFASDSKFSNYLQSLTYSWGRNDPAGALVWARAQKNAKVNTTFLPSLLGQWANYEPEKAAAQVNLLTDPAAKSGAVQRIASEWSEAEPEKAIAWLAQMPEGNQRENALSNAVGNWSRDNPENASAWLNKLPIGSTRDSLITTFTSNVAEFDPVSAATWASAVGDENSRRNAIQNVLSTWARNDKVAARQWLSQQNLAAPDLASFREQVEKAQ